jgi:hypothetical protein
MIYRKIRCFLSTKIDKMPTLLHFTLMLQYRLDDLFSIAEHIPRLSWHEIGLFATILPPARKAAIGAIANDAP